LSCENNVPTQSRVSKQISFAGTATSTIEIDVVPPTLAIEQTAPLLVTPGGTVTLSGTAADVGGVAAVVLYNGVSKIAELPLLNGRWQADWVVPDFLGEDLVVVARDNAKNETRQTLEVKRAVGNLRLTSSVPDQESVLVGESILFSASHTTLNDPKATFALRSGAATITNNTDGTTSITPTASGRLEVVATSAATGQTATSTLQVTAPILTVRVKTSSNFGVTVQVGNTPLSVRSDGEPMTTVLTD
jgi:hypothetical protein